MSLRLRQAIPARPSSTAKQPFDILSADGKGFIVYPSGPNIVILDNEHDLVDTLQFWAALPHRAASSSSAEVEGVCCSPAEKLILAWSDVYVVIWKYAPSKTGKRWTVHSTLLASAKMTCVDFHKGYLALGTASGIELWRTDLQSSVTVWDRLWDRTYPSPSRICLSPATGHLAWQRQGEKSVFILTLDRRGQPSSAAQELRHPRPVDWIGWRRSRSSTDDAHLCTLTTDSSVLRVYSPVLDDPVWFQLLSTLDSRTFAGEGVGGGKGKGAGALTGRLWVLTADVLREAVTGEIESIEGAERKVDGEVMRMLQALDTEESDLVACIAADGTFTLRSIVNIDRKPPTLLRSLHLASLSLRLSDAFSRWSPDTRLLFVPSTSILVAVFPPTSADLMVRSCQLSLADVLASRPTGVSALRPKVDPEETIPIHLAQPIESFVRTPNGRGLLALGKDNEMAVFAKRQHGKPVKGSRPPPALLGKGLWREKDEVKQAAMFAKGRAIVFASVDAEGQERITLQHLNEGASEPCPPVVLPGFRGSEAEGGVEMLLAVSDIDDGHSGKGRRTRRAIIIACTASAIAYVWRVTSRRATTADDTSGFQTDEAPDIHLLHRHRLSVEGGTPRMILPVDPMGWHQSVVDWQTDTPLQDMILSVSRDEGVLEFWSPQLGHHLAFGGHGAMGLDGGVEWAEDDVGTPPHMHEHEPWTRGGVVRTGKAGVLKARCSSRKKTVLICEAPGGRHEMTIWDSKVSEFSTGLELTYLFDEGEEVQDLDWTSTSDLQSVLAVGFKHRIVLVCERRMSYVEKSEGWAPFLSIDIERYTPLPIADSIWLAGGSLAVATANQIYLFSRFLDRDTPIPSPSASARSVTLGDDEPEDIFQLIAQRNGPLQDYHPVLLAQALLWNKVDLVKGILEKLQKAMKEAEEEGKKRIKWKRLEPEEFFAMKKATKRTKDRERKYDGLFDAAPVINGDHDDDDFTPRLVKAFVQSLDGHIPIGLNRSERSMLATIAQATLEAEEQRRSLDFCGFRYLISIRIYTNLQRMLASSSGAATPVDPNGIHITRIDQARLSFRNIVWASHSDSQDVLLSAATDCCSGGKMLWEDAKRLGVFLWLKSPDTVRSQLEVLARNRFMADENRDPTTCSLVFFALGKKKVVHGLWRQAPGHKEQSLMLKFLANDFELERWKTAAAKNAYALMSKQRYEYAAAFFMLAGSPRDAINVIMRQLDDWQLAFALASVVEAPGGPLVKWILTETVLPMAFAGGHRWLATWAFWTLNKRDLAIRILISPMDEVARSWSPDRPLPVGNPENDDPSLLLLFQHLKSKSLQTAKGTSEIAPQTEFDFVLHNARVFFRMGCHALALDLIRSWSFERPFFPAPKAKLRVVSPAPDSGTIRSATPASPKPRRPSLVDRATSPSYSRGRRQSFMLSSGHGYGHDRGESMVMDMDVLAESEEPSRAASPLPVNGDGDRETMDEPPAMDKGKDIEAQREEAPRKMGNLMKELKQDVKQGAEEFNMDNFF